MEITLKSGEGILDVVSLEVMELEKSPTLEVTDMYGEVYVILTSEVQSIDFYIDRIGD